MLFLLDLSSLAFLDGHTGRGCDPAAALSLFLPLAIQQSSRGVAARARARLAPFTRRLVRPLALARPAPLIVLNSNDALREAREGQEPGQEAQSARREKGGAVAGRRLDPSQSCTPSSAPTSFSASRCASSFSRQLLQTSAEYRCCVAQAPEPLARLYSRNYYRATWIATALDAGFATAMHIRPTWLKDIMSVVFAGYYLINANEADEKVCTRSRPAQ